MSVEAAVLLSCYLQAVNVSKIEHGIVLWASSFSAFTFGLMCPSGCQALLSGCAEAVATHLFNSLFCHRLAGLHAVPVLLHHSMPLQFHSSLNLKCIRRELQSLGNFTNPSPLSAV